MNYRFICPGCKQPCDIEEILVDVSVSSVINSIEDDSFDVDYGAVENLGGKVDRYQCRGCGFILKNDLNQQLDTIEELVDYLDLKGMLVREGQITCSVCDKTCDEPQSHFHHGRWYGPCHWDERLRTTQ